MQKITGKLIDLRTAIQEHKIGLEVVNMVLEQSEVNLEVVRLLVSQMLTRIDTTDDTLKEMIDESGLP